MGRYRGINFLVEDLIFEPVGGFSGPVASRVPDERGCHGRQTALEAQRPKVEHWRRYGPQVAPLDDGAVAVVDEEDAHLVANHGQHFGAVVGGLDAVDVERRHRQQARLG